MGINTQDILKAGQDLVNWSKVPPDTNIHVEGDNIHKVLVTIDVGIAELLLAKKLDCDAVVTHHPIGLSALHFYKVFDRHIEYMIEYGIPRDIAEDAVRKIKERARVKSHGYIYNVVVDAARILNLPLVNVHQPCDEYMRRTIYNNIMLGNKEHLSDIIKSIQSIPEFKNASTKPEVIYGASENKVKRWVLVVAAGTNGGFPVAKAYFQHGISTVIYLHVDHTDIAKLHEEKLNGSLIVLGHLAGDSIGVNALADRLEDLGLETIRMGILPSR
jgi:putative NIF3 family GTP cyclohydrolase 1 type 2